MIGWWFRDRETGRTVVAQWPNLSLGVFLGARIADRLLGPAGTAGEVLVAVGTLALLWWAADEILRGVNPFRRVLGTAVLAATLASLVW